MTICTALNTRYVKFEYTVMP
ncbi:hypothetical protein E2320_002508, partial [Naja naja]